PPLERIGGVWMRRRAIRFSCSLPPPASRRREGGELARSARSYSAFIPRPSRRPWPILADRGAVSGLGRDEQLTRGTRYVSARAPRRTIGDLPPRHLCASFHCAEVAGPVTPPRHRGPAYIGASLPAYLGPIPPPIQFLVPML